MAESSSGKVDIDININVVVVNPKKVITKTKTTVVKCCLVKHLNNELSEIQRKAFLDYVDKATVFISKMCRRASLVMLFHVDRVFEENLTIPDFTFKKNSTWWKNILKIGLVDFNRPFPDADIEKSYKILLNEGLVSESLDCGDVPSNIDQVIGSAAIQFTTIATNNLWVPLINRIKRFAKMKAAKYNDDNGFDKKENRASAFDLLNAIRSGKAPIEEEQGEGLGSKQYGSHFPEEFLEIAKEIRAILNAPRKKADGALKVVSDAEFYLWDNSSKELNGDSLLEMNHWLIKQFKQNDRRGLALFPIFGVDRKHIRLDEKMLINLINVVLTADKPKRLENESKKVFDKRKEEYNAVLEEWNIESYSALQKENPKDPMKSIPLKRPLQASFLDEKKFKQECENHTQGKRPTKKGCTDMDAYKAALDEYNIKYKKLVTHPDFIARVKAYKQFRDTKQRIAKLLFPAEVYKLRGKDFSFEASIMTDGVSVSFAFEKTIECEVEEGENETTAKKKKTKVKAPELLKVENFDHNISFITPTSVTVGLDPGRVDLGCMVVYDPTLKKKKHSWSLSRGQYHVDSGILKFNKQKHSWFKTLHEPFSRLTGSSLKSGNSQDVKNYLKIYNEFSDEWWRLALRRRESRGKMQSYIGKRKVLDAFFNRVKTTMQKIWPGRKAVVAYGSAGPHMKATGKGELAVPTSTTYLACKRIFGPTNTVITDESNTTKICACCKCKKQAVYINGENKLFASDTRKLVPETEKEAINKILQKKKLADIKRRGGKSIKERTEKDIDDTFINQENVPGNACTSQYNQEKTKKMFYPEVRGLRFCPNCRKFLNRDKESAKAIGMLHMLSVTKGERPICFTRQAATTKTPKAPKVPKVPKEKNALAAPGGKNTIESKGAGGGKPYDGQVKKKTGRTRGAKQTDVLL